MAEEKEGADKNSTNGESTQNGATDNGSTTPATTTAKVVNNGGRKPITVTLDIVGFKFYTQPREVQQGNRMVTKVAAIITMPSKNNPSPTGVFEINQKQFERISIDAVKVANPMVLGLAIDASNGSAKLKVDLEHHKVGEAWSNPKTGASGVYGFEIGEDGQQTRKADAKDWTNQSNHAIVLSQTVVNKFNEIAFGEAVRSSMSFVAAPTRAIANVTEQVEEEVPNI